MRAVSARIMSGLLPAGTHDMAGGSAGPGSPAKSPCARLTSESLCRSRFGAEPDLPQRCLQRMRASFAPAGKSLLLSSSLGAAAGLAVFGIETVLVLRSADAMLAFDRS